MGLLDSWARHAEMIAVATIHRDQHFTYTLVYV
jgi:hypothetical protein